MVSPEGGLEERCRITYKSFRITGGERGIRKLAFPIELASCRLEIAAKTTDAILARAACPMLPDGPTEVSSWDVLQLGRTKELA
jgi:hypothetical protein